MRGSLWEPGETELAWVPADWVDVVGCTGDVVPVAAAADSGSAWTLVSAICGG